MNTKVDFMKIRLPVKEPSSSKLMREEWVRAFLRRSLNILSIVLLLFGWEIVARSGYFNSALFPPPSKVVMDLMDMVASGQLSTDVIASGRRLLVGYFFGAILGLCMGLVTGRYYLAENFLSPIFQVLRPIPPISFVPIAILWFGLGEFSKYFLVFWGVFFPVWINTHLGVQRVDQTLIRAAQSLGARERKLLFAVVLPGAFPQILAGLRTAVPISFYCLVAAEIAGAYSGVAYNIDVAHLNFQVGHMFAGLIVLGLMSAAADWIFVVISKFAFPWAYRT